MAMTESSEVGRDLVAARSRRRGGIGIVGGGALLLVAIALVFAGLDRSWGVPWTAQWGGSAGGPVTIQIVHPDGRLETDEAATMDEAETMVDHRFADLWDEYDMGATRTRGRLFLLGAAGLAFTGLILVILSARRRH